MQILHTDKGDLAVKRAYQASVDAALIIETPDGRFVYRDHTTVPRSILEAQGILPPLALEKDEINFEKEYQSAGRARSTMTKKDLSDDKYIILGMKSVDGKNMLSDAGEDPEFYVIRKKDSPDAKAFVARADGSKPIEE